MKPIHIRPSTTDDHDAIWNIMKPVIRGGQTYALPLDMNKRAALDYWITPQNQTFVAEREGKVLGIYKLGPNNPGPGNHIANCSYMTDEKARGKGIARTMCTHSIAHAKSSDFLAIQFNFVIANNKPAIGLWESMGFEIVGRLPKVFNHPTQGLTDALVMFRTLNR